MYEVQAYDLVGNTSSSAGITVTTPGTLVTFTPTADAYVQADAPSSNYGASTQIVNDNSPVKNLLLKFEVTGLSGRTILSARLRLYCLDPSSVGGDFWPVDDTNWSETNVTWNTAPAAGALKIGSIGAVVAGNSYELDVTSLIGGDGIYSIKGTSTSSDGAYYASKERANPPQLLITVR
jgi:hypothetical protein